MGNKAHALAKQAHQMGTQIRADASSGKGDIKDLTARLKTTEAAVNKADAAIAAAKAQKLSVTAILVQGLIDEAEEPESQLEQASLYVEEARRLGFEATIIEP